MKKYIVWILQLVAVIILVMEAIPKLTGATECQAMFTALGMEPSGRVITGILEITAALLLLLPNSTSYGAVLASGLMCGAIIAHFTRLGVHGHHLTMIIEASIVLVISITIMYLRRHKLSIIGRMFAKDSSS